MVVDVVVIGKTDSAQVAELVEVYRRRINHYLKFNLIALPDVPHAKNLSEENRKRAEGERLLGSVAAGDYVVLLDERGETFDSVEFASWIQKRMNAGVRRLVFMVGGPYGFSDPVARRADARISLSRMTFSHQIVRAIFAEQLYRAFTILHNEPYHHQ